MSNLSSACKTVAFVAVLALGAGNARAQNAGEAEGGATEGAQEPVLERFELRDGQRFVGTVESEGSTIVVRTPGGARIEFLAAELETREPLSARVRGGKLYVSDPNASRYLYGPSAFMLKQGQGYFAQKELLFSSIAYGVTDWLTLQTGGVIPAWFVEDGFNLIGALKLGTSITDFVHVAAGVQSFFLPTEEAAAGLAFASLTLGVRDGNVTVSGGLPFSYRDGSRITGDALLTLSASMRISPSMALVTENWLILGQDFVVGSVAGRFFGDRLATDVGVIVVSDVEFPIPWLGFAYNFRNDD